ncbi:hypothetical protein DFH09DRAFT_1073591 [Mycena vulgaris]|nr:hypothetical protein DFH09DRAFT_1073591 [Mycena vulgaris]
MLGFQGGAITYDDGQGDAVPTALADYSANHTDPKTGLQMTYASGFGLKAYQGRLSPPTYMFLIRAGIPELHDGGFYYNAPTAPAGIFDAFLAIPAVGTDVGTCSYLSHWHEVGTDGRRMNPLIYVQGILQHCIVHSRHAALLTALRNNWFDCSSRFRSHGSASSVDPMPIYYEWTDAAFDGVMLATSRASAGQLRDVATTEGILASALHPNYALFRTPVENLYGVNTERLREIRRRVD